jgi:hypothetical protein
MRLIMPPNSKTRSLAKAKEAMKRYLTQLAVEKLRRAKICLLSSFVALDLLAMVALVEFLGQYHQSEGTMPCG